MEIKDDFDVNDSMRKEEMNGEFDDDFMPSEEFSMNVSNNDNNDNINNINNFNEFDNWKDKRDMDLDKTMKETKLTFDSPHEFDNLDDEDIFTPIEIKHNGNTNGLESFQQIHDYENTDDLTESDDESDDSFNKMKMGSFSSSAQAITNAKPLKVKKEFPSTFKEYTMNSMTNEDELPVSGSFVSTFDV